MILFDTADRRIKFEFNLADMQQQICRLSAVAAAALTTTATTAMPAEGGAATAVAAAAAREIEDTYTVTPDDSEVIWDLMCQNAAILAQEFDKFAQCAVSGPALEYVTVTMNDTPRARSHSEQIDHLLKDWLVWHTLDLWYRLKHADKLAVTAINMQKGLIGSLRREIFYVRSRNRMLA